MKLNLYCNRSAKNCLNKAITLYQKDVPYHIKDKIDIINPVFVISERYIDTLVSSTNYVMCQDLGRYYFAKPVLLTGGEIELHCEVDVLMSMRSYIQNTKATLKRQEFKQSPYVVDNKLPISKELMITQYNFSATPFVPLTDNLLHCITLTTTGGV